MKQNSKYLFVYGTLLGDDNEFAIYLKQHCSFYSKGRFKGGLYDLGDYPGAVLNESCDGYIYGSVVELTDPQETLKYLDDYEGFGEDQDQPNLFIRKIVSVETDNGQLDCWGYLYNLSIDGLRFIASGDYSVYKRNP